MEYAQKWLRLVECGTYIKAKSPSDKLNTLIFLICSLILHNYLSENYLEAEDPEKEVEKAQKIFEGVTGQKLDDLSKYNRTIKREYMLGLSQK